MKKTFVLLTVLVALVFNAQAWDLSKALGGGDKSSSDGSTKDKIGNILGGVVDGLTGTKDINLDNLVGTWTYSSPAVTLASENALQQIGGAAATGAIEDKLVPYYERAGLNKVTLTIDAEHNFTMKLGFGTLNGTVEKNDKEGLIFNFKAFKSINLGHVKTMASQSARGLTITFDVSRLKEVLDKASALSGNATIQGISSLLSTYDGVYMGFRLTKQ